MTSRERIMAVLEGRTPDRLVWWPELNDGFIRAVAESHGPVPTDLDRQTFVNHVIGADQLHREIGRAHV